jgi:hypothetical protein
MTDVNEKQEILYFPEQNHHSHGNLQPGNRQTMLCRIPCLPAVFTAILNITHYS